MSAPVDESVGSGALRSDSLTATSPSHWIRGRGSWSIPVLWRTTVGQGPAVQPEEGKKLYTPGAKGPLHLLVAFSLPAHFTAHPLFVVWRPETSCIGHAGTAWATIRIVARPHSRRV